jgi:hypothetical protein
MTEHPSRPGAFAAAVVRRYGDVPITAPPADMIVRLNPRLPAERISPFETHVQIAPRVTVTCRPASMCRVLEPARPHQSLEPPAIVQRLAHRQRRLEPDAPARPADLHPVRTPSGGALAIPAAPAPAVEHAAARPRPVPMIVCRRGGETPAATARKAQQDAGSPQTFERHASKGTHADPRRSGKAPAGIDLEQITEKVVRAIDKRIVAYRERTARS